jgi:hypothetical protein
MIQNERKLNPLPTVGPVWRGSGQVGAIDLVTYLKTQIEKLVNRDDRRRAIRELTGP